MFTSLLLLAAGLVVLFAGGHYLVRGATTMALLARISTTVVALTVVAMGTSLPELAVATDAALRGATDLAYGNIVGSCIFNMGAILGTAAVIGTIPILRQTIRYEYPVMFMVSCLALALAHDRTVDWVDGAVLVVGLTLFVGLTVFLTRRGLMQPEEAAHQRDVRRAAHLRDGAGRAWGGSIGLVVLGIVALVVGADLSVEGGVRIARHFGVEERVIGLTIIAMGTSLPELATSITATYRREPEIALGNVVGSNIFNLLGILGVTAVVHPIPIHDVAARVDNWVMLAFAAVLFPIMLHEGRIRRFHGVLLLTGFAVYMGYVVAGT